MTEGHIYLQQLLMYGSAAVITVLGHIKNPEKLFDMSERELIALGLTPAQAKRGDRAKHETEKIIKQCEKDHIKVVTLSDERYPQLLRETDAPPAVLYYKGEWVDFDREYTVGIVGTRNISEYGAKAAFSLAARLAAGGAVIVSGGALGGDTFAHSGALSAPGGRTVAVTGGGLSSTYLKANAPLRERIVRNGGLLVTEFSPDYTPRGSFSFPIRNRVLAGLCKTVAVIEAGAKSGTLITAHHAAEMGREVFSMPGSPTAPQYVGTNRLISEGARLLLSVDEILSEGQTGTSAALSPEKMAALSSDEIKKAYAKCIGEKSQNGESTQRSRDGKKPTFAGFGLFKKSGAAARPATRSEKERNAENGADQSGARKTDTNRTGTNRTGKNPTDQPMESAGKNTKSKSAEFSPRQESLRRTAAKKALSGNELQVYAAFRGGEYLTDELVERVGLPTSAVLSALTMLEIKGYVKALPGGRYKLS